MTRTGKIARLPREIREQLNRRLQDGEAGVRLVDWLNSLPQAKLALAVDFGGREINEQNLSEWKNGGYLQWLGHQEVMAKAQELADRSGELQEAVPELTEHLAATVAGRFAAALVEWDGQSSPKTMRELRTLRAFSAEIAELRRGDHSAARLKLERERVLTPEHKTVEGVLNHFLNWMEHWKVREVLADKTLTPSQRRNRLKEFFHVTQENIEEAGERIGANQTGSE